MQDPASPPPAQRAFGQSVESRGVLHEAEVHQSGDDDQFERSAVGFLQSPAWYFACKCGLCGGMRHEPDQAIGDAEAHLAAAAARA